MITASQDLFNKADRSLREAFAFAAGTAAALTGENIGFSMECARIAYHNAKSKVAEMIVPPIARV